MQSTGNMKGELIFELHSKSVTVTVRDISETGIKLEQNSVDQANGKVNANGFSTVTIWQKVDGSSEWENKGVLTTTDGDFIAAWGKGTGKNTGPTTAAWSGEVHFMSQSPKLAWLNGAKGWVEGNGDQAKGEAWGKVYLQK